MLNLAPLKLKNNVTAITHCKRQHTQPTQLYRVVKKVSFKLLSSPNIGQFVKFFHWRILWEICNNANAASVH